MRFLFDCIFPARYPSASDNPLMSPNRPSHFWHMVDARSLRLSTQVRLRRDREQRDMQTRSVTLGLWRNSSHLCSLWSEALSWQALPSGISYSATPKRAIRAWWKGSVSAARNLLRERIFGVQVTKFHLYLMLSLQNLFRSKRLNSRSRPLTVGGADKPKAIKHAGCWDSP